MDRYEITRVHCCSQCQRGVAAVDRDGWCRGCIIRERLTDAQIQVLQVVRYLQPTTMHEVADEMGYASVSSATHHLKRLRELGLVEWTPGLQRTIHETVQWEGEEA